MRFETRIALRYLWAARRQAHTAFLSGISTLGLGVGVATLIISLALLSGLQGKIKNRLMTNSPTLLIEASGAHAVENADAIVTALEAMQVDGVRTVVRGTLWASSERTGSGRPMLVRSFHADDPPRSERAFGRAWEIPSNDQPDIALTRDAAATLGVSLGEPIILVAPRSRLTPFGPVPVWKRYRLVRLLPPSTEDSPAEILLPFDEASSLFATAGHPTAIEVRADVARAASLRSAVARAYPDLVVRTWQELNKPLLLALRLEKVVMFITISLIVFVAALNLISSISMLIVEKRPQVGILRTIGAPAGSVARVFLTVGLLIGLVGTVLGNVIGLSVSWLAETHQLVPLPADVYAMTYLPFSIDLGDVIGVNAVAILLSVVATWYPARLASRLDPIQAIRDE